MGVVREASSGVAQLHAAVAAADFVPARFSCETERYGEVGKDGGVDLISELDGEGEKGEVVSWVLRMLMWL